MIQIFIFLFLIFLFGVITAVSFYNSTKPMPPGTSIKGVLYRVPSISVKFLYDITYLDGSGKRRCRQEIFDEFFKIVSGAKRFIVVDMFLINSFQGPKPEHHRDLCREFVSSLILKKREEPSIQISVITDPINTVYGGLALDEHEALKKAGINLIYADLDRLRESNLFYSGFWRVFFRWAGNSVRGGIFPDILSNGHEKVTLRSYMRLLNFKADHRKLLIADSGAKISLLVMSANISDEASAHVNFGVRLDDFVWTDALESEMGIAGFSGGAIPPYGGKVGDENGGVTAAFITEGRIADAVIDELDKAGTSASISISQFYLSDRRIIDAFIRASRRGADIRIILDPNKDAFGVKKNGNPNRPVAAELLRRSSGKIKIRWYDTHGEQAHGKMMVVKDGIKYVLIQGSANYTRRNIRDLNLEADVYLSNEDPAVFYDKAMEYFETAWGNKNGMYCTAEYGKYKNESVWSYIAYRVEEMTGICTY
jgi:phosphatidylserine/phosphatidylglycerophosphate/cardiolipin synthase-like enzyme